MCNLYKRIQMKPIKNKPKHAYILQGDWEHGLALVAKDLLLNGTQATKVILEPCDLFYKLHKIPTVSFNAPLSGFKEWLRNEILTNGVDCLFIYNQYRPYNAIGYELAEELGIECIILELGLLRPDYITIYSRERDLFSYLEKEWRKVKNEGASIKLPKESPQIASAATDSKMLQFACSYTLSRFATKVLRMYTHYEDQRSMSFRLHFKAGIRGLLRLQGRARQSRYNRIFSEKWSNKYYLVPLQVHCDSQITARSSYQSVEEFITEVVDSFEKHAPLDTRLVFKVHPMDRGYVDYNSFIKGLDSRFVQQRLIYLDRVHNPTVLKNAIGSVMINSSMGLSSLIHGTPVKTVGQANFDLPELTHQGSLDTFWRGAEDVDLDSVKVFIALLRRTSQGRGTFYKRLFSVRGNAKIQWPEEFGYLFPEQEV